MSMVNMTKAVELARMCYNSDIGPCPVPLSLPCPFDCCCTDVTPQHWEEILNNEQDMDNNQNWISKLRTPKP